MRTVEAYSDVIAQTGSIVHAPSTQHLAERHGRRVMNITWEDTARFDFSAVGSNISDITIQSWHRIPETDRFELICMPVIRYPNFTDLSGDISPDEFYLLFGNEKNQPLTRITLRELLGNLRAFTRPRATAPFQSPTWPTSPSGSPACTGRPTILAAWSPTVQPAAPPSTPASTSTRPAGGTCSGTATSTTPVKPASKPSPLSAPSSAPAWKPLRWKRRKRRLGRGAVDESWRLTHPDDRASRVVLSA